MADEIKLRKCPFCGGRACFGKGKIRTRDGFYQWQRDMGDVAGNWLWKPYAGCRKCRINAEFDSVDAAVKWWNGESVKSTKVAKTNRTPRCCAERRAAGRIRENDL